MPPGTPQGFPPAAEYDRYPKAGRCIDGQRVRIAVGDGRGASRVGATHEPGGSRPCALNRI